jgi:hypothetical protein
MRPPIVLVAMLIAAVAAPTAGAAQARGGYFRPAFARFHPRFERGPPGGPFLPRGPYPPAPVYPQGGPRPPAGPPPPSAREAYPGGDGREQQDTVRQRVREGQMAPLGGVIDNLRHIAPGRQLDTGVEYEDGRAFYRVRWLTKQGRRVDYIVDAATGRILGER